MYSLCSIPNRLLCVLVTYRLLCVFALIIIITYKNMTFFKLCVWSFKNTDLWMGVPSIFALLLIITIIFLNTSRDESRIHITRITS